MTDYSRVAKTAGSIAYFAAGVGIYQTVTGGWLLAAIAWFVCAVAFATAYHATARWVLHELARLERAITRPTGRPEVEALAVGAVRRHAVPPSSGPKNSPT